jgi:hypothetical protein
MGKENEENPLNRLEEEEMGREENLVYLIIHAHI